MAQSDIQRKLAESLFAWIPMESAMAIGDAMNDLSMIEAVGFGCAPANALGEVKRRARYVSKFSNDEDAVADLVNTVAL